MRKNLLKGGIAAISIFAATAVCATEQFERPLSVEQSREMTMLIDLAKTSMIDMADRDDFLDLVWAQGIAIQQFHESSSEGEELEGNEDSLWRLVSHQPTPSLRNLYTQFWDEDSISYIVFQRDYTAAAWDHAIAVLSSGESSFEEEQSLEYIYWHGLLDFEGEEYVARLHVQGRETMEASIEGAYHPDDFLMRIAIERNIHGW
jgi:hypothetical protein